MQVKVGSDKLKVWLVQQGVWDLPKVSMPLAAGYLHAALLSDPEIASQVEVRVFPVGGAGGLQAQVPEILFDEIPDVLACTVWGWNYQSFGALAETFRGMAPDGWVIWGGNHVSNKARRTFGSFPYVDVVVNGEGEFTFVDLIRERLNGTSRHHLGSVDGISFKAPDGAVTTTPGRPRIEDLDQIPSPFLVPNALNFTGPNGAFAFELGLQESSRGCPYKCSFCYWGGAIGQKIRRFSQDRLAAELDVLGYHKATQIVLCDANFGLLEQDAEYLESLIRTREKYGYPRQLDVSWAKNKSKVFFSLVSRMREVGLRTSFTLALQSVHPEALATMQRSNMKINKWESLANWLEQQGMDCYGELVAPAPGETLESFYEGYDQVSRNVSRVSIYPLLLLPNTEYSENREKYGIVAARDVESDFEYILSHDSMSFSEVASLYRFGQWARVFGEYLIFRWLWVPLRELAGIPNSNVIRSLDEWLEKQSSPIADALNALRPRGIQLVTDRMILDCLRVLHSSGRENVEAFLRKWWDEEIADRVPHELSGFLDEVFRFEMATRPIWEETAAAENLKEAKKVTRIGIDDYYECEFEFAYDVPGILAAMRAGETPDIQPKPTHAAFYYLCGFGRVSGSHEFVAQYCGKPKELIPAPPKTIPVENRATSQRDDVGRETAHLVQDLEVEVA